MGSGNFANGPVGERLSRPKLSRKFETIEAGGATEGGLGAYTGSCIIRSPMLYEMFVVGSLLRHQCLQS